MTKVSKLLSKVEEAYSGNYPGLYVACDVPQDLFDRIIHQFHHVTGYELQGEYVEEPHVTVLYDDKSNELNTPESVDAFLSKGSYSVTGKNLSIFGKYLVLEVESPVLSQRRDRWVKDRGYTPTFRDYKPHMSITKNEPSTPELDEAMIKFNQYLKRMPLEIRVGDEYASDVL